MKTIKRLICKIFGHKLRFVGTSVCDFVVDHYVCERCGERIHKRVCKWD
ncbi:MAG: hypothetical protein J1E16_04255 [Muribaculaceae bacterium]|nr:hypothetical protein [Muribaculaceae bacterium]